MAGISVAVSSQRSALPVWMVEWDIISDEPSSPSSDLQRKTATDCLDLLTKKSTTGLLPRLERHKHVKFLRSMLGTLPSPYAALDASRPWMLYWSLNGLALLGEDVTQYRESLIDTLRPIQNHTGGFGGGEGQYSHLATTYAAVLALIIVGGREALGLVDRNALWKWLGRLKQREGDFAICEGGERDTRAAYCACVMISIFNLPLALPDDSPARSAGISNLTDGLPEWVGRCQSYDGGISNAPGSESHGAYTFCALACLCVLGSPGQMLPKYLNVHSLTTWLAARQHAPEGGCAGRANKLVDGCYSHWIGGCWPLIEAALNEIGTQDHTSAGEHCEVFNKDGLIRYILCCCQATRGGLRDKPTTNSDAYHSCYGLAGLSSTQSPFSFQPGQVDTGGSLTSGFLWMDQEKSSNLTRAGAAPQSLYHEDDRVPHLNPVFVVPQASLEATRGIFPALA